MVASVSEPHPSPDFEAALALCLKLSDEERHMLFAALGVGASLQAWCDGASPGIAEPKDSSPVPSKPSCPASAWWPTAAGHVAEQSKIETAVTGCPWCRRPVAILGRVICPQKTCGEAPALIGNDLLCDSPASPPRRAYVTLLYGPSCHEYFMGALVLGFVLVKHACGIATDSDKTATSAASPAERVLLHTPDVPETYLNALKIAGWTNRRVEYLSSVSRSLFHNWRTSRFVDVFTKLRALQLTEYQQIMLLDLDLLVRSVGIAGGDFQPLESVFDLQAPAAMKRGPPVPNHGQAISYAEMWGHPTRRTGDALPFHQQASGINAGVMLLRPDAEDFALIEKELRDWYHPEHYATYMPEQEYLSRFYGTFSRWTHMECCYNYEIDKNERVPHDFTERHEAIRTRHNAMMSVEGSARATSSHPGALVLHYSGLSVKPWKLLWEHHDRGSNLKPKLLVTSIDGLRRLREDHGKEGSEADRLDGYSDHARLWAAMLEWLDHFLQVAVDLHRNANVDVIKLVQDRMQIDEAAALKAAENKRAAEDGPWQWQKSSWARSETIAT